MYFLEFSINSINFIYMKNKIIIAFYDYSLLYYNFYTKIIIY